MRFVDDIFVAWWRLGMGAVILAERKRTKDFSIMRGLARKMNHGWLASVAWAVPPI